MPTSFRLKPCDRKCRIIEIAELCDIMFKLTLSLNTLKAKCNQNAPLKHLVANELRSEDLGTNGKLPVRSVQLPELGIAAHSSQLLGVVHTDLTLQNAIVVAINRAYKAAVYHRAENRAAAGLVNA